MLLTQLIESPSRWIKALFEPDAHPSSTRYLARRLSPSSHFRSSVQRIRRDDPGATLSHEVSAWLRPSPPRLSHTPTHLHLSVRLSLPIDECISHILDLINDLLTTRFFLRFLWVPGHLNPSESLIYYGNSQAASPIWHAPLYTPRPSTPSSGDVAPNHLLPPLLLNWVRLSSTSPISSGAPWCA